MFRGGLNHLDLRAKNVINPQNFVYKAYLHVQSPLFAVHSNDEARNTLNPPPWPPRNAPDKQINKRKTNEKPDQNEKTRCKTPTVMIQLQSNDTPQSPPTERELTVLDYLRLVCTARMAMIPPFAVRGDVPWRTLYSTPNANNQRK